MSDPGAYGGPPPTRPPSYGPPPGYGYGPPAYGPPPGYGYPPVWGPPQPVAPHRPGPVTGAAVLSFVQFGFVLLATLYLFLAAMLAGSVAGVPGAQVPAQLPGLVVEGLVLAGVQLAADVLLLVAAIRSLRHRSVVTWRVLVAALGAQVVIAGYWLVRLLVLRAQVPGDGARALGSLVTYAVLFGAVPLVALGLVLFGSGRRWFDRAAARG